MPTEVIMPKVDMDMASGRIVAWHVAEGAAVAKGDPLFDIETDKAAMEVEAPADGILHHAAPEGAEIPIGTPCAWLYAKGEKLGAQPAPFAVKGGDAGGTAPEQPDADDAASARSDPAPGAMADTQTDTQGDADTADADAAQRATPRARALARENGIAIAAIAGTGPRARVQAGDVQAALDARATAAPARAAFLPESGPLAVSRGKGGAGTPVVLLHGFASDATSWAPLEAHLRDRPVIRIDLPGHGRSPKRAADSFADLVRDVRHAFDGLNLSRAHLVGHSLGGAVALALADTRPDGVAGLTLIAPAGLGPEIDGAVLRGICNATRAASLGPWLRSLAADEAIVTDSYVRLAMAARADARLRAAQAALAEAVFPDGVQAFDLRAALDRVAAPARIVWGRRDAIIPWTHALRAPGRVALHLFDGIGHMPQIECPEAVAAILKENA